MQKIFRLLAEAGFLKGVVNLVNGAKEAVDAILDHPKIRAISFVGSTPVAKYVYSRGTANGKRVQAQGGAKNPIIVLPDADMLMAKRIAADSAFGCAGQRCLAASIAVTVSGDISCSGFWAALCFMRQLQALCDDYGLLLIADEIQTGFGRTGAWFAIEYSGVVPDILIMTKDIPSGLPISGFAAPLHLMEHWPAGSHGSAYDGNIVACAAAIATIEILRSERLVDNSREMGELLQGGLRHLQEDSPEIGDVRGLGLMAASEFSSSNR